MRHVLPKEIFLKKSENELIKIKTKHAARFRVLRDLLVKNIEIVACQQGRLKPTNSNMTLTKQKPHLDVSSLKSVFSSRPIIYSVDRVDKQGSTNYTLFDLLTQENIDNIIRLT